MYKSDGIRSAVHVQVVDSNFKYTMKTLEL